MSDLTILTYNQRKAVAEGAVTALFNVDFRRPPGVGDAQAQAWSASMIELVVRESPTGFKREDFERFLGDVRTRLRAGAKSRGWPTEAEVKEAIGAVAHQRKRETALHGQSGLQTETKRWFATWIKRGEQPPSRFFDEACWREMLDEGMVTERDLEIAGVLSPKRSRSKEVTG